MKAKENENQGEKVFEVKVGVFQGVGRRLLVKWRGGQ
jgi:hypothetical protein